MKAEDLAFAGRVADVYREMPGLTWRSPKDVHVAADLRAKGASLEIVQAAVIVGMARRLLKSNPDTGPVSSLAYFTPIVVELQAEPPEDDYLEMLRSRLRAQKFPDEGED